MTCATWERVRDEYMAGKAINWISAQTWAPSKPTVLKAVHHGVDVRMPNREVEPRPSLREMRINMQPAIRASEGAAKILSVIDAAVAGTTTELIHAATTPHTRRLTGPDVVVLDTDHPPGIGGVDRSGATAETVLRELARVDGATAIAEEVRLTRAAKTNAQQMLEVTHGLLEACKDLKARVLAKVPSLPVDNWMDVLLASKIIGTVTLAADRATRTATRVLQLERELMGDPRDSANATGTPGETFAMTPEEALAELRRCSLVAERYGVPFAVGASAELAATVIQQDTLTDTAPVFVAARDDEPDDRPDESVEE
jgi:hypothetical protein